MRMRKVLMVVLVAMLVFALGACGKSETPADTGSEQTNSSAEEYDGASFGIDLESEELQLMSETRATKEKLREARDEFCDGQDSSGLLDKYSYKDFADYIGCDATEYIFGIGERKIDCLHSNTTK